MHQSSRRRSQLVLEVELLRKPLGSSGDFVTHVLSPFLASFTIVLFSRSTLCDTASIGLGR